MASDGASYALKWSIPKNVPPEAAGSSAAQPASSWLEAAPQCENLVPIFEVAYNNGKWLPFPRDESLAFYQQAVNNENARYASNTDKFREYVLDFGAMEQINIDNDRRRSLRLAWVNPNQITPSPCLSTISRAAQPASTWLETALVPFRPPAPILENLVPIFEVVHADGMLWSLPRELSKEIYDNTYGAQQTRFTRYMENNGEFQAYLFDVEAMEYINIDDAHQGSLRLAWVNPGENRPSFTGQIPGARRKRRKN